MRLETVEVSLHGDCSHLLKRHADAAHFDRRITRSSRLVLNGETVGVYINIPRALLVDMRRVVRETKPVQSFRTNGVPTQSSVFGSLPRHAIRNDFCRFSEKSRKEPEHFVVAFEFANYVAKLYRKELPEAYARNLQLIRENVHPDWLPGDHPFTTCNFNINHAIRYHRDTGNFRNVFSNVLILKEGIEGGELVFSEFRIALAQDDGALGIFDGQKWVHGVLPIARKKPDGYRASIVFYALDSMRHCYPYAEEITRYQSVRTHREKERALNNPALRKMNNIDPEP